MKKIIIFNLIAVFLMPIFLYGCGDVSNQVYATEASYNFDTYTAYVCDNINFSENLVVEPANLKDTAIYTSSNSAIIEINALTGEAVCLSEGTAIIYVRVKKNETTFVGDNFTITVQPARIYATDFMLDKDSLTVGLNDNLKTNILTLVGENVNELPTVSYSETGIVTYDPISSCITPLSEGVVTVFVTLKLSENDEITKEFAVSVVNQLTTIEAERNITATNGEIFFINFVVRDYSEVNNLALYQTCSAEILSGSSYAVVVEEEYGFMGLLALSPGSVTIKLTYSQNAEIYAIINILVN